MEGKMNICQRINVVQKAVEKVKKTRWVKTGFDHRSQEETGYMALEFDYMIGILRKELVDNGIVTIPTINDHKTTVIEKVDQDGKKKTSYMTEIKLTLTYVNIDDKNDTLSAEAIALGLDSSDKGPGKALSYAVKYALLKTLMIESGDDEEARDDEPAPKAPAPRPATPSRPEAAPANKQAPQGSPQRTASGPKATGAQAAVYQKLCRERGIEPDPRFNLMTSAEASNVISGIIGKK